MLTCIGKNGVCVCVCIYMCIYIYIRTYMYIHARSCTRTHHFIIIKDLVCRGS
jgi:hypothetical protein